MRVQSPKQSQGHAPQVPAPRNRVAEVGVPVEQAGEHRVDSEVLAEVEACAEELVQPVDVVERDTAVHRVLPEPNDCCTIRQQLLQLVPPLQNRQLLLARHEEAALDKVTAPQAFRTEPPTTLRTKNLNSQRRC